MKFTFKTTNPIGKYRSFYEPHHDIKLNKKVIGSIDSKIPYRIRLQVTKENIMEDGNPNCEWKWIVLKKTSQTLQEAKEFLNNYCNEIQMKYKIRNYEHKKNPKEVNPYEINPDDFSSKEKPKPENVNPYEIN